MRAIVHRAYGPSHVLHLEDVPKPEPKPNELRVRVIATTVTSGAYKLRSFNQIPLTFWFLGRLMFGLTKPRNPIPGGEFSGIVESVGQQVTKFKVGDEVFGFKMHSANAEYLCIAEDTAVVMKPEGFRHDEAAALPFGTLNALHFLRKANVQPNDKILIIGASGAVGCAAVQIAKVMGAKVIGVCSSRNVELVQSLGADAVIDYTKAAYDAQGGDYDVVLDTVGASTYGQIKDLLNAHGRYAQMVFGGKEIVSGLWAGLFTKHKLIFDVGGEKQDDLMHIADLVKQQKIRTVIDRAYPLEETASAHAYAEQGHKLGAVVITVADV